MTADSTDSPAPALRLTSFSHGGGCGCKIAPGVLSQILKSSAGGFLPKELMVGIETADDAAVYRLNDTQALIATTDFFMVGVMSAALKKDALDAAAYQRLIETTTRLNTPGIALAEIDGVHAITDVTGFGLAGHALEMRATSSAIRRPRAACSSVATRRRWPTCSPRSAPRDSAMRR